jgi:AraC-like DNA-binding protein
MKCKDFSIPSWALIKVLTRDVNQVGELTAERLARELNTSRAYLYRTFKAQMGMAPAVLIKLAKVAWAAILLEETPGMSVKEISEKVGFNTTDYFTRIFKEYYGTTPFQYRKIMKKVNAVVKKHVPSPKMFPSLREADARKLIRIMRKFGELYYIVSFRIADRLLSIFPPSLLSPHLQM